MNHTLELRPVEDNDVTFLETWLHKEYIRTWYNDPNEWLDEINERNGSFSFLHHYIVMKDGKPMGFGQYYDCFDAQEEWYSIDEPNRIYSFDYLIGEEEYLGKGYGKEMVRLLVNRIYEISPEAMIIVQPDNDNIPSCKAILANGFIYDEEKGYFLLSTKEK